MELAFRTGSKERISDLAICIENESSIFTNLKEQWRRNQKRGQQYGDMEVNINELPLSLKVIRYCQRNVALLPALYSIYSAKLEGPGQAFWRVQHREATKERIKLTHSANYDSDSADKTLGWDEDTLEGWKEDWNKEIYMEACSGTFVLDKNDNWVPAPTDELENYLDRLQDGDDGEEHDFYEDTARDCIGWEEGMIQNGEDF